MDNLKNILIGLFVRPNLYLVKRILIVTMVLGLIVGLTDLSQTSFVILPLIGVGYFVYLTLFNVFSLLYRIIKSFIKKWF